MEAREAVSTKILIDKQNDPRLARLSRLLLCTRGGGQRGRLGFIQEAVMGAMSSSSAISLLQFIQLVIASSQSTFERDVLRLRPCVFQVS
jgi:hypothetical protein